MSFKQPHFTIAVSIICGVLIFFLFKLFSPDAKNVGESWAVLVLDEDRDDREIRESLKGISSVISESSQEILIDDFGTIKKLPLDSYYEEIEPEDPRNDGYAAKLRSFFSREGKRFFFFPLEGSFANRYEALEKRLALLLPGIPFSLVVLGRSRPVLLDFIFLTIACGIALYFSKARRLFLPVIPVLLAMGWGGAGAVVLATIMAAIWELLREPLGELFAARSYNRSKLDYAGAGLRGIWERLKPFRVNLLLVIGFLFSFLAVSIALKFSLFLPVTVILSFIALYPVSYWNETKRAEESQHTLFRPVLMVSRKAKTFSLFPFLSPFVAASVLAMVLPGFSSPRDRPAEQYPFMDPEFFVSHEDYLRHAAFQQGFSFQPLDQSGTREEYLHYYLGEDGLIAESSFVTKPQIPRNEDQGFVPMFPLEKLMGFLIHYYQETDIFTHDNR